MKKTKLPDNHKTRIEELSRQDIDSVQRVPYEHTKQNNDKHNEDTQVNDIHVAPGQKAHIQHNPARLVYQTENKTHSNSDLCGNKQ